MNDSANLVLDFETMNFPEDIYNGENNNRLMNGEQQNNNNNFKKPIIMTKNGIHPSIIIRPLNNINQNNNQNNNINQPNNPTNVIMHHNNLMLHSHSNNDLMNPQNNSDDKVFTKSERFLNFMKENPMPISRERRSNSNPELNLSMKSIAKQIENVELSFVSEMQVGIICTPTDKEDWDNFDNTQAKISKKIKGITYH
eukprot:TRINITY_DN5865_c0_g1_i1.p1 TRINITY_DN5865_c0_g1~~TRINITY_DN5865_c0_g1_i1.p1  ORF type:complete len:198 (-),score=42.88 TRINITY_DN5865_c0_g1_i1:296-889(-)